MIEVREEYPGQNIIDIHPDFLSQGSGLIELKGRGNVLNIAKPGFIGHIHVLMTGDNALAIEETCYLNQQSFHMLAPSSIRIGEHSSFNVRSSINIHEPAKVSIGERCLFASDVTLSCSTIHKIYDMETKERVNPPGDIKIGSHVWVAANVSLWGGASVGNGSVVGYGSFVSKEFPENCVIAGTPARVVRENITWEA
ncbi:acyltransferase [Neorhizobium sp. AL 9.2.2]|uniref:acyltransferase n=1 Tax=Neorhizobium sp. AL 9.2.2 TaxID=2712894 RepID=UPI0015730179|nr:acyltransferase [Neorhizobium sp. AL 9.2.2]